MLTPKKEMFAKEYLVDLNATRAAIAAGYSEDTAGSQGQRLLKDVDVARLIQDGMDKRAAKVGVNSEYVFNVILETIERCSQAKPVYNRKGEQVFTTDKDGAMAAAYMFDSNAVLKGAELLGKHLKLFTDKTEVQPLGADGKPSDGFSITINHVKSKP